MNKCLALSLHMGSSCSYTKWVFNPDMTTQAGNKTVHFSYSLHNLMYSSLNSQLQSSVKCILLDVTSGSDWCLRPWSSWHWKHEWACRPLHCTSAKLKTRSRSNTVYTNIFYRFLNETMALLSLCFFSVSKPWKTPHRSTFMPFARSGLMVRNKLCWDGSCKVPIV